MEIQVGKLEVTRRNDTGKGIARKLRSQGLIPGICYGASMEGTLPIVVDPKALRGSLDPTKGENTLIDLTVADNGASRTLTVMLRDYQIDPIKRTLVHVDLVAIDPDAEVEVDIPVELTGRSIGVFNGGTLHVVTHSIEVSCRPADIPSKFLLDITELDIGDVRHVSDVDFPSGVTPSNEKLTIVTCVAPEVEVVSTEEAAPVEGAAEAKPAEKGGKKEGGEAKKD
jgi:large subunit ribosomal protein L25